jgi:hypothetical protein
MLPSMLIIATRLLALAAIFLSVHVEYDTVSVMLDIRG